MFVICTVPIELFFPFLPPPSVSLVFFRDPAAHEAIHKLVENEDLMCCERTRTRLIFFFVSRIDLVRVIITLIKEQYRQVPPGGDRQPFDEVLGRLPSVIVCTRLDPRDYIGAMAYQTALGSERIGYVISSRYFQKRFFRCAANRRHCIDCASKDNS